MAGTLERGRDVAGGVLVMATGAGFFLFGRELAMGTSFRMGAGYFPTILSLLMIALGAVLTVLALRSAPAAERVAGPDDHAATVVPWRGLLLVIGAVLVFGFLLRSIGLGPSVLMVVLATAWASRYATVTGSVLLSVGLAIFCSLLFIRLLGLPLPLLGPWLTSAYWSPPAATEAPATPAAPAQ